MFLVRPWSPLSDTSQSSWKKPLTPTSSDSSRQRRQQNTDIRSSRNRKALVLTSNSIMAKHFCMRHDAQSIDRLWHGFEDICIIADQYEIHDSPDTKGATKPTFVKFAQPSHNLKQLFILPCFRLFPRRSQLSERVFYKVTMLPLPCCRRLCSRQKQEQLAIL